MDALNKRHFEHAESASDRSTLIDVCNDPSVALDAVAAAAFLETDELKDEGTNQI